MLTEQFNVAIPPESEFVRDLASWRYGPSPTPNDVRALMGRLATHPRLRSWGLSQPLRGPDLEGIHDRVAAYRECITVPFEAYAAEHGAVGWGDKTPSYVNELSLLNELWPAGKFIFIERDGRDVFCSNSAPSIRAQHPPGGCASVAQGYRMSRTRRARIRRRVMVMRYEDLVAQPHEYLRILGQFLELTPKPARPSSCAPVLDQARAAWFPRLRQSIDGQSVGRYRHDLTNAERSSFECRAGRTLNALGYVVCSSTTRLTNWRVLRDFAQDAVMRLVHFVQLRVWHERCREVRYVISRKMGK